MNLMIIIFLSIFSTNCFLRNYHDENVAISVSTILKDSLKKTSYTIFCCNSCLTSSECSDIAEFLLTNISTPKYVLTENYLNLMRHESISIVILTSTVEMILSEFEIVRKSSFYHKRAKFYFIICQRYGNRIPTEIFKIIWSSDVFDFVILYHNHQEELKIFTYNEFEKGSKILEVSTLDGSLFPNKLENMNGYSLEIVVYDDFPRSFFSANMTFRGRGADFTDLIAKQLNASIKFQVVKNIAEAFQSLQTGTSELCAIEKYMDFERDRIEFSYPYTMDSLVAFIPKPTTISPYKLFLSLFDYEFLIIFFVMPLVGSYIHSKLTLGRLKVRDLVLKYFGIVFGVSIPKLGRIKNISLLLWIMCTLVVQVFLSCILVTRIINAEYERKINKWEELPKTKLRLITGPVFFSTIQKKMSRVVEKADRDTINAMVWKQEETNKIVFASRSYFETMLRVLEESKVEITFEILEDPIAFGASTYMVKAGSPYLKTINKVLFMSYDFKYERSRLGSQKKTRKEMQFRQLTFEHFFGSFLVISIGYTISFLIFLLELFLSKFNSICCRI